MARRNKRNAGGRETAARPDYKKTHRKLILTCVITLLGVLAAVAFLLWYLESGKTGLETAGAGSGEEIVAAPVDNPASQLRALLRSRDLAGAEALYEQTVRGNAAQEARVDAALFAEFDRLAERVRVENYPQTTALEHMENMLPYVKDERMHAFLSGWIRRGAAAGPDAAALYERLRTEFRMENTYLTYPAGENAFLSLVYVRGVSPILEDGRHVAPRLRIEWEEGAPVASFQLLVGAPAFTDYGLDVVSCRDAAGAASARAEGGHRTISRYGAADVGWTELTHQEKNAAALILPPNVDGSLRTDLAPWAEILAGADSELVFSGGGRKTAFLLTEEERAAVASLWSLYEELRDTPGLLAALYGEHDEQWIADFKTYIGG